MAVKSSGFPASARRAFRRRFLPQRDETQLDVTHEVVPYVNVNRPPAPEDAGTSDDGVIPGVPHLYVAVDSTRPEPQSPTDSSSGGDEHAIQLSGDDDDPPASQQPRPEPRLGGQGDSMAVDSSSDEYE